MQDFLDLLLDSLRARPFLVLLMVAFGITLLIAWIRSFRGVTEARPVYRSATLEDTPDAGLDCILVHTGEYTREPVSPSIARIEFIVRWFAICLLATWGVIAFCSWAFPTLFCTTHQDEAPPPLATSTTPDQDKAPPPLVTSATPDQDEAPPHPARTNSVGMELIHIQPGKYQRGARDGEAFARAAEKPRHWVQISRGFNVGKYPVTQGEYRKVMGHNPSHFSRSGRNRSKVSGMDTADFPVESISWYDAVEFCNKLSVLEKLSPYYELTNVQRDRSATVIILGGNGYDGQSIRSATAKILGGNGYRLLTEAEWEYVARAGSETIFPWGDSLSSTQANFVDRPPYAGAARGPYLERTTKVGSYKPNAWGLYDTAGNVWEWVWDVYNENEYRQFANKTAVDPTGPSTDGARVLRGGCWDNSGQGCRSAYRNWGEPEDWGWGCGFRVAQGQSSRVNETNAETRDEVQDLPMPTATDATKMGTIDYPPLKPAIPKPEPSAGKMDAFGAPVPASDSTETMDLFDDDPFGAPPAPPSPDDPFAVDPFGAPLSPGFDDGPFGGDATLGFHSSRSRFPTITNSLGMEMIRVRPGKYQRGARERDGASSEKPRHWVQITREFMGAKYPVTQVVYTKVMGHNPSHFSSIGSGSDRVHGMDTADFPVECVSWFDAIEFCNRLSALENLPPYYELTNVQRSGQTITRATVKPLSGNGYRLLTDAEWEYMARGGKDTIFPWGNSLTSTQANFDGNYPYGGGARGPYLRRTTEVGSYEPNAWGFHDIVGNVWEWVWDAYGASEYQHFAEDAAVDPIGPSTGETRILRGGSWNRTGQSCRPAVRFGRRPNYQGSSFGFRVAHDQSSN